MDTALYQWYIDYHFILGNKVNVKLFKRKATSGTAVVI